MNEIQAEQMAEGAAMGEALMELLAKFYWCEPTEEAIKKSVYKHTSCGAWIAFTETGVKVGSIVEGCDFGTEEYDISYNGDDKQFMKSFFAAIEEIETEADFLWREYNE